MTASEFKQIGERLYGPNWRGPLALELKVSPVTIWRYASGMTPIPHSVAYHMNSLLEGAAPR